MNQKEYQLFLIRHGETVWNKERRLQGQTDTPLSEFGKEQASKLAEKLKNKKIELIFSSDLKRAKETSEQISHQLGIKIIYHPGLREIHLGEAQGILESDLPNKFGEESYSAWKSSEKVYDQFRFPGGESKSEAELRIIESILNLLKLHRKNNIAICSHGFVLSRFYEHFSLKKFSHSKLGNCEVIELSIPLEIPEKIIGK
ncbi:histidine phosphatase family protein [Leptospira selangorensis]|uniref:Histidine phosphatase family protein n=1 Tax=Leptospira selangorensis TaxID=2484982 RepID=A0A4V6QKH7_9LEPT|nr:histidine phosphatase family protein [Leptospira selangorensis]TGK02069.1 histidine phosphatase family protein [Leptospira selangorensis]TGM11548.1 histidine phosphatase family protein [Leptospira selangorensis]TGM21197.1 histidine phosphatase family protein [Leptospira selangorensis]